MMVVMMMITTDHHFLLCHYRLVQFNASLVIRFCHPLYSHFVGFCGQVIGLYIHRKNTGLHQHLRMAFSGMWLL
jgi:hypothetical protein